MTCVMVCVANSVAGATPNLALQNFIILQRITTDQGLYVVTMPFTGCMHRHHLLLCCRRVLLSHAARPTCAHKLST